MKGSTIMTANRKTAAEQLVSDAADAGLVTEENKTVPSQNGSKPKVSVGEGTGLDGEAKTIIHLSDAETNVDSEDEAGKIKKLVTGVKLKVTKNKKSIIAGGVAVLAIALGVTVQKKRTGTDEESEVVEPATEA